MIDTVELIRFLTSKSMIEGYCGALGGLASFLLAIKKGHYKNNRYVMKFLVEVFGAAITTYFVMEVLDIQKFSTGVAFFVGTGWAAIIEGIRTRITAMVNAALGDQLGKRE
ncbi:hypothetical protein [Vibrio diazotrophicus]|uniref:hypothetical protein n=1 Tax=Vibrio diazotrophicus TaxID=685 RepID=UPI003D2F9248